MSGSFTRTSSFTCRDRNKLLSSKSTWPVLMGDMEEAEIRDALWQRDLLVTPIKIYKKQAIYSNGWQI